MNVRLLGILISINTWCFAQIPGDLSSEANALSGMRILLKNPSSFADDPASLCSQQGWNLSFQRIQRLELSQLSSNRLNLSYHNFGLSLGQQAVSPLQIWSGLIAAGIPTNGSFQGGVFLSMNAFNSLEKSFELIQITGCLSLSYQIRKEVWLGIRWEHQQFNHQEAFSKPSFGFRLHPDKRWQLMTCLDWHAWNQSATPVLGIGFKFNQAWSFLGGIANNPFTMSLSTTVAIKKINIQIAWSYGHAVGPLLSQTLLFHPDKTTNQDE